MSKKSIYEKKPWLKVYGRLGIPTPVEVPDISICQLFDEATERWKDRIAIEFYGSRISYWDLRERVDRLATALQSLGIGKGDVVALLLLNSPEHVIAFHGVLKTGATVTQINPMYVSPEIKRHLIDSGASTVICQDILWKNVEKTGVNLRNVILTEITESLPVSKKLSGKSLLRQSYQKMSAPPNSVFKREDFYTFQELIKKHPPNPGKIEINPKEDIAAIPYTGGTTGWPKGVMRNHFNYISDLKQTEAFYTFMKEGGNMVLYQPFYHVAGQLFQMVLAIGNGFTSVILTKPDLDDIIDSVSKYKPKWFQGAPTIYEMLKDHVRTDLVNWKTLRFIMASADVLHQSTVKDWKARTGSTICDCYGQSEFLQAIMSPEGAMKPGSIGIPLPNNIAGIAYPDKDVFVPLSEVGELVVSGPTMTKGYWKNPEATKDKHAVINGEVYWRTGDLAAMDEDGYFYIYGRERDIIKYKGIQVYPREVEEVISTHPQVKAVGVTGVPDIKTGQIVKALVVQEADARGKLTEAEIVKFCQEKLTHFKIPKIVAFVDEIPKTATGKVSRKDLS